MKNEEALISQGMRQVNRNHVIMLTGAHARAHLLMFLQLLLAAYRLSLPQLRTVQAL